MHHFLQHEMFHLWASEETDVHAFLECSLALQVWQHSELTQSLWIDGFCCLEDCFIKARSCDDPTSSMTLLPYLGRFGMLVTTSSLLCLTIISLPSTSEHLLSLAASPKHISLRPPCCHLTLPLGDHLILGSTN